jgi:hypothetical protein
MLFIICILEASAELKYHVGWIESRLLPYCFGSYEVFGSPQLCHCQTLRSKISELRVSNALRAILGGLGEPEKKARI